MSQIDTSDLPVYSCVALGESLEQALGEPIPHCAVCWIAQVEEKRPLATVCVSAHFPGDGSSPRACAVVKMCCECAKSRTRRQQLTVIAVARAVTGNPFPKVDLGVLRSYASNERYREHIEPDPEQTPCLRQQGNKPVHATSGTMFGPHGHRQEKPD